jgi:hypothetical protein
VIRAAVGAILLLTGDSTVTLLAYADSGLACAFPHAVLVAHALGAVIAAVAPLALARARLRDAVTFSGALVRTFARRAVAVFEALIAFAFARR